MSVTVKQTWAALLALLALSALLALASGCVPFSDVAHSTKGTIAVALYESATAWAKSDLDKQLAIVESSKTRDEAEARLKAHREGPQAAAVKGLTAARHALGTLISALAAYEAGSAKEPDVTKAIDEALKAARELLATLKAAGVKLPEFKL